MSRRPVPAGATPVGGTTVVVTPPVVVVDPVFSVKDELEIAEGILHRMLHRRNLLSRFNAAVIVMEGKLSTTDQPKAAAIVASAMVTIAIRKARKRREWRSLSNDEQRIKGIQEAERVLRATKREGILGLPDGSGALAPRFDQALTRGLGSSNKLPKARIVGIVLLLGFTSFCAVGLLMFARYPLFVWALFAVGFALCILAILYVFARGWSMQKWFLVWLGLLAVAMLLGVVRISSNEQAFFGGTYPAAAPLVTTPEERNSCALEGQTNGSILIKDANPCKTVVTSLGSNNDAMMKAFESYRTSCLTDAQRAKDPAGCKSLFDQAEASHKANSDGMAGLRDSFAKFSK
jgi:hypothetical protein